MKKSKLLKMDKIDKELPVLLTINVKEIKSKNPYNIREIGLANFYWHKIKDIEDFSQLWKKAVYKKCPKQIYDYLNALSEAYGFIHFSIDTLKELSGNKPNNDYVFLVSYFYYSLIHNIKKTLDTLALIIKVTYSLPIKDEWCDLFNDWKKKTKIFSFLEKENKFLCEFLLSSEIQDWLEKFSRERISITHKNRWPIFPEEIHPITGPIIRQIAVSKSPDFDKEFTCYELKNKLNELLKINEILITVCKEINKKY